QEFMANYLHKGRVLSKTVLPATHPPGCGSRRLLIFGSPVSSYFSIFIMGSALSNPQKQFLKDMQHLLRENKQQVPEGDLIALILAIDEHCPWFPEDGTWEIPDWDKIGDHFHGHGRINLHVLSAWAKVRGCMATLTPKNILLASLQPQQKQS
ncbi:retrovirus group K member 5 Gag polyproteinpolyprotein-like-like, partial [Podarcis lilfordi]